MTDKQTTKLYNKTITVGMTGASGAIYGLRLLKNLAQSNCRIFLMISSAAKIVLKQEEYIELPDTSDEIAAFFNKYLSCSSGQMCVYEKDDWFSPVASGSGAPKQMVICPCTAGTLSAVAHGSSDTLLERAADVVLKERGQLILVLRETPLSIIHIENMLKLSRAGVTILPAIPSFYNRPKTVTEVVDSVISRVLDHLGIKHNINPPWGA